MLALLLALVAGASDADDPVTLAFDRVMNDHLTPIEFRIPVYEAALEQALDGGRPGVVRLEIVELPSFEPEGRARIVERDGRYEVVSVRAAENAWYGTVMKDLAPGPTRGRQQTAKERRCAAPIARATYEKLRQLWRAAIDGAVPIEDDEIGVDGTTYVFALHEPGQPLRKASAWSPDPGTRVLALVGLGRSLIDLPCAGAAKEPGIAAAADALAVRFGAR